MKHKILIFCTQSSHDLKPVYDSEREDWQVRKDIWTKYYYLPTYLAFTLAIAAVCAAVWLLVGIWT